MPIQPNLRWSVDFMQDVLVSGRRFCILTIVDNCSRRYPALVANTSLADSRQTIERWRLDNNHVRPHSTLGDLTTEAFEASFNRDRVS